MDYLAWDRIFTRYVMNELVLYEVEQQQKKEKAIV
jgi:hypothetical protein